VRECALEMTALALISSPPARPHAACARPFLMTIFSTSDENLISPPKRSMILRSALGMEIMPPLGSSNPCGPCR